MFQNDKNGNYYIISSEYGELIYDQPELIKMKKVTATHKSEVIQIQLKYPAENAIV